MKLLKIAVATSVLSLGLNAFAISSKTMSSKDGVFGKECTVSQKADDQMPFSDSNAIKQAEEVDRTADKLLKLNGQAS